MTRRHQTGFAERPLLIVLGLGAAAAVFFLGWLGSTVVERRAEAHTVVGPARVKLDDWEPRSRLWQPSYPREYDTWQGTRDTLFRSAHGGGATIDMLAQGPALVVLWAGYAFSKDYNQGRGHAYTVEDVRSTLRTGTPSKPGDGPMPGTCWACKSPDALRIMKEGGPDALYGKKWGDLGSEVVNPIGCADCHDPATMNLRIARPALIEALQRRGVDPEAATHQEKRSLVCAQCHVEYYFKKGPSATLLFPWDKGLTVEAMEAHYDTIGFTDWVHAKSRAPMLKAQHPDYELFSMGIHAERGVACADCHMPYRREGASKFTDHHVQSPLNNIANSCQVCHRESADALRKNVYDRQEKVRSNRVRLEDLLVKAHFEAAFAWEKGADSVRMIPVLKNIRRAQWRWDFVAASHGGSFHAPVEALRILGDGITLAGEARLELSKLLGNLGFLGEVPIPDISDKAKAQAAIGLDMDKLREEKRKFLDTTVRDWVATAKTREAAMPKPAGY